MIAVLLCGKFLGFIEPGTAVPGTSFVRLLVGFALMSCVYGFVSPHDFHGFCILVCVGDLILQF